LHNKSDTEKIRNAIISLLDKKEVDPPLTADLVKSGDVVLLVMPAPIVAHELWKTVRLSVSDIKLLKEKKLRKIYSRIKEMLIG